MKLIKTFTKKNHKRLTNTADAVNVKLHANQHAKLVARLEIKKCENSEN